MPYTIKHADGTRTINVQDNDINQSLYIEPEGVQLIGRNALNYGQPTAQNFLQLTENFASRTILPPSIAQQGQIQFRQNETDPTNTGDLYIKLNQSTTASLWAKLLTVSATPGGGLTISGTITADDFVGNGTGLANVTAKYINSNTVFNGYAKGVVFQGTQYKLGGTINGTLGTIDVTLGNYWKFTPAAGPFTLTINWPAVPSDGGICDLIIEGTNLGAAQIVWPTVNWQLPGAGGYTTNFATYASASGTALQSNGKDWVVLWTDATAQATVVYGKVIR